MSVTGPSRVTLDSENRFFDQGTSAAGSDCIDLTSITLDSDDYLLEHRKSVASSDPYHTSVIGLDDNDEIQGFNPIPSQIKFGAYRNPGVRTVRC